MAAALATAVKGRDVVSSAPDLRQVAADQLDIDTWAFEQVLDVLEEVGYVRNRQQTNRETQSFYETVPEDFERLYQTLGEDWASRGPGEVEKSLLAVVDDLSFGPRRLAELDIDPDVAEYVSQLGEAAESVRIHSIGEERIAYSPFFAYEHPESIGEILETTDVEAVRQAFEATRAHQGLPLSKDTHGETARALVGAGLLAGPSLERPDGTIETFSVAPYGLSRDLLTLRRPVLDRALALLAAVRMGEHFGGMTNLHAPAAVLRKLLDPTRITASHSSTRRQYAVLQRMGVVRFASSNDRTGIQLIDTPDNHEAVLLALDLIAHGEAMAAKAGELEHGGLMTEGIYRTPIQAIQPARQVRRLPPRLFESLVESAMGRRPIE
jgi:hypothetical protein